MWNVTDINWNEYSLNYEGKLFKEVLISDGLRSAAIEDFDYWEDFTGSSDIWENFTSSIWGGTVFTEVTMT